MHFSALGFVVLLIVFLSANNYYFLQYQQTYQLEQDIQQSLEETIRNRCNCSFDRSAIYEGEFSCQTTTTRATYRARINGTSDILPAPQLLRLIDSWRNDSGTLLYGKLRLRLADQNECPLEIESFDNEECDRNVMQEASGSAQFDTDHCYKMISIPNNCLN